MKFFLIIIIALFALGLDATESCLELIADGEGKVSFEVSVITTSYERVEDAKVRVVRVEQYFENDSRALKTTDSVIGFTDSKGNVMLFPRFYTYSGIEKVETECREYQGFNALGSYLIIEKDGFLGYHISLDKAQMKTTFYREEKVQARFTVVLLPSNI